MKAAIVGIAVTCMVKAAAATDIVAWIDAQGVRHFTNVSDEIPEQHRASAQIVARDRTYASVSSHAATEASAAPEPERAPPRRAESVADETELARAYLAGLRRGIENGDSSWDGGGGGGGGGGVQINGPLAVATARDDNDGYGSFPPWEYGYLPPAWYPFVTTSFDRGRSRHLTLRMLLQDQFQLDRAAPYVFVERLPPFGVAPLGPNLNPFLARGLPPYSIPATTRVITR